LKRPTRRIATIAVAVCCTGLLTGCGRSPASTDWSPKQGSKNGLTYVAHTTEDRLVLSTQGGEVDFMPGVNLGSTIPGSQPGELAIGREEFRRWLPEMASLGLHAVRIYTILPPAFYEELRAFNLANPTQAIYVIQGVWIPEEAFLASQDLFDPAVHDGFMDETADAVAAAHGTLARPETPGKASGTWTADVSPWVYAYSLGVEWDPVATSASDEKNAGRSPYVGTYFSSKDGASPTEIWLAEMLDFTAQEEAALGRTMPLTFTNWPTTDPLTHPEEPLKREDLVGVDANHIEVSGAWPGGYFASYHAYPYYPDFQRYEPALQETTYNGVSDPYAGYLEALRKHHEGIPVMITEFGVPSSMGLAHTGPLGRDQGDHSEQEQTAMDAQMLRMIHDLGFSGACVFEWADEWFKFTWNTIDYELPSDRRRLWVNPWTNEEHFGLLAMDPGASSVVTVDGDGREWNTNSSQVIYEGPSGLREVRAVKDEGYLYLRLVLDDPTVWEREPITIGIDVLTGGNGGLPGLPGQDPQADYAIVLGPGESGQAYVRASNDQYEILWGKLKGYIPFNEPALANASGVWNEETLITNRPLIIPSTQQELPVESFDAGQMRYGTSDPASRDYDCRATWCGGDCLEIRLPYEAVGFSDPSSLQALHVGLDGTLGTETAGRVGISVAVGSLLHQTKGYGWDPWQTVTWHERVKSGSEVFAAAVADVTAR
jgi:hypothetical protein